MMYVQKCTYKKGKTMKSKTERITIRMTPEEKRRLEYCAEKNGKDRDGDPDRRSE